MGLAAEKCIAASPFGYKPLLVKGDVSRDEDCRQLVKNVIDHYERFDVLVNNAGVIAMSPIDDPALLSKLDSQMAINVRAPVLLCSPCAPHLAVTKGNIVNISSGIGLRAVYDHFKHLTCDIAVILNSFDSNSFQGRSVTALLSGPL